MSENENCPWYERQPDSAGAPGVARIRETVENWKMTLKSALALTQEEYTRPILGCVLVQAVDDRTLRFRAADGFALAIQDVNTEYPIEGWEAMAEPTAIPGYDLRAIIKTLCAHKKSAYVTLTWQRRKSGAVVLSVADPQGLVTEAKSLDGKFPDFSHLIPEDERGEFDGFWLNPQLLGRAIAALNVITEGNGSLQFERTAPKDPALIEAKSDRGQGLVVIMPMIHT